MTALDEAGSVILAAVRAIAEQRLAAEAVAQAAAMAAHPDWLAAMAVDLPEGEDDGMLIARFEAEPGDPLLFGRHTRPGTYTGLWERTEGTGPEGGPGLSCWMTDVDAERVDHFPALAAAHFLAARRVLVNGLGLGMVVGALLGMPDTEHVDVVERDERVIRLAGPAYAADPRVTIHHADALAQRRRWPAGTRWDLAWHDIWPDASARHKDEVMALTRSYGPRCRWQGVWLRDTMMGSR